LARHFIAAAPAGSAAKAIEYARRAGDRAAAQLAYEEAARLYEEALALVDDDTCRCELLLSLGDARARAGDIAAAKRAFSEAADVGDRRGLDEHMARAALGYGGRLIWDKVRDPQFVSLIERALAVLGERDNALRVRLLIRLVCGPIAGDAYPWERRAALSREALEMARRIGDPETLAFAIDGYMPVVESPANTRELLTGESTELLRIATETGDDERIFDAHNHRLERLFELGEMGPASAELEAMAKLADRLRQPTQKGLVTACRARLALHEGSLAEAQELIADGSAMVGRRTQAPNALLSFTFDLQSYLLLRQRGRLDEAAQVVRRAMEQYPDKPIWRCALTQLEAEIGNVRETRQAFDALAADGFRGLLFDDSWLASMSLLAEAVAAIGEADRAALVYERLLPYADRVAVTYSEISLGSVARYLGLLAATMGRLSDAEVHFDAAIEANEQSGARPWLTRTLHDRMRTLSPTATTAGRQPPK
jgi:tetratricopeptide (TPR) repeat protein